MPSFKLVTLFNQNTAISNPNAPIHRGAGWSETLYSNLNNVQAVLAEANRQGPAGGASIGSKYHRLQDSAS